MAQAVVKLLEIRGYPHGQTGGRLTCPPALRPAPGQFLLASVLDSPDPLPVTLYPCGGSNGLLDVAPPLPPTWTVGSALALRGPLGRGFQLPPQVRRVALAALDGGAWRLLPLVQQALERGADVTLYADEPPAGLPLAVEVLPGGMLAEAFEWAGYLALDAPGALQQQIRSRLGLERHQAAPCPVEVLLRQPMPCGGNAECGVCGVPLRHNKWNLACKDGPVFLLDELEE
jgi:hypothetical protein